MLTIGLLSGLAAPALADTTVYVVRHAEKRATPANTPRATSDPELTDAGQQRAIQLARVLRSADITATFSSQFKRTRLTAEPTAERAKVKHIVHPAGEEKGLVELILGSYANKSVLVVAHSNTIPKILRQLGYDGKVSIKESDYDNLFVVRVGKDGNASSIRLHYGAENPAE